METKGVRSGLGGVQEAGVFTSDHFAIVTEITL